MLPETTTADPAGLPSTSRTAADLELIQDIGSGLLDLARGIARSVGSRVRDALRSAGAKRVAALTFAREDA